MTIFWPLSFYQSSAGACSRTCSLLCCNARFHATIFHVVYILYSVCLCENEIVYIYIYIHIYIYTYYVLIYMPCTQFSLPSVSHLCEKPTCRSTPAQQLISATWRFSCLKATGTMLSVNIGNLPMLNILCSMIAEPEIRPCWIF